MIVDSFTLIKSRSGEYLGLIASFFELFLMGGKTVNSKITLLLAFLVFGVSIGLASHIKGGWMHYKYLGKDANGNLRYEVIVKLYRSCNDGGPNDPRIYISAFRKGDTAVVETFTAPNTGSYDLKKTTFHPCLSPIPNVCYTIKEYKVIVALPPNENGYELATQGCCRIGGIRNLAPPTQQTGHTYFLTIPGTKENPLFIENNSPLFSERDTVAICINSRYELDFSAKDPDGDSLVYFLTPALNGGSPNNFYPNPTSPPPFPELEYRPGFSGENPFNNQIEINKFTGVIKGISPNQVGEYVLAVHVNEYKTGKLIATTRKELHINVANCTIPVAELPAENINCDNYEMSFENLSSSPAITSYFWDFGVPGSPNNISTLPRPNFTYPDTGTFTVKLVVNRGDACSDSAFSLVKIYPGFKPGFKTDGACFNIPINFTDTTKNAFGQITSWQWNFGDPNSSSNLSTLQNPAHQFSGSGTFKVELRVISNKGCDKTIKQPFEVLNIAPLSVAFRDTVICGRDSIRIQAIGAGNFTWLPNNGTISDRFIANPIVFPNTTTTYRVTVVDRGCINTDSVRVNVISSFTVKARADTTICLGDTVQLSASSALATQFSWSPALNINNSSISNPLVWPNLPSTSFVVTAVFGKCEEKDTVVVNTVPYPQANAGNNVNLCFGQTTTLQGSGTGNRFEWQPTTYLANPNSPVTEASPKETTLYTLYVYDNQGCTKPGFSSVLVKIVPPIQIYAGKDTSMVVGQALQLNAQSTATNHSWSPSSGLSNPASLSPVLTLSPSMISSGSQFLTYKITGTNAEGCIGSDEITVRVFSTGPSIFVPNAFTPNNDGLNDKIRPVLAGIRQLEYFRIFNRYGQLVYETKDPESAWDGKVNGKEQGSSNFIYQVQAIDFNGEVLRKNGSFVLIR